MTYSNVGKVKLTKPKRDDDGFRKDRRHERRKNRHENKQAGFKALRQEEETCQQ